VTTSAVPADIQALLAAHKNRNKQLVFKMQFDALGYAKHDGGRLQQEEVRNASAARRRGSAYIPGTA